MLRHRFNGAGGIHREAPDPDVHSALTFLAVKLPFPSHSGHSTNISVPVASPEKSVPDGRWGVVPIDRTTTANVRNFFGDGLR
jgi:hypothetical protein